MSHAFRLLAVILALLIGAPVLVLGQEQPEIAAVAEPLDVGVYVNPPFIMQTDAGYSGMAIELWEDVAGRLGLDFAYRELATISDLVSAAESGAIDVALTNLTITRGRAERIEFTHPWFDAGQRLLVHDDAGTSFNSVIRGLASSGHLRAYAWIAVVIVFATIVLTLFDRRFDRNFPQRWRDGVAESFYTVMSVATSGRPPARKNLFGWLGRIWQALWLMCGVAVLAYVTSSVTSVMTTLSLTSQINSVADLSGRAVAVQHGSVAERYAVDAGLQAIGFAHFEDAVAALVADRVAAIIADAPVLEYFEHRNPEIPVSVVGAIFEPDKYGFALPIGSPLTRPLSIELIGAHEAGDIEAVRIRYFGAQ